ncbi:MAG TPA: GlsB/YeaQ/YmgE family stress response membrane protein [Sphingobium sp.]|nr:GlsB/YeaQ/YmgE family stress response membrane protein [Sphingobium sp.]
MGQIISFIVVGLIVGILARFFYPGPVPLGVIGTILLGIGGSFVGGFLSRLISRGETTPFEPAGLIGSVIGGIVLIFLVGLI